jgi:hypothetical protein
MERKVKKREKRKKNVSGFSLQWCSKSSSSMRTVAMANLMTEVRRDMPLKNTKRICRKEKKNQYLCNDVLTIETNQTKRIPEHMVVDGMMFGPTPDLDIYKSDNASVHWIDKENGVFSALIIPRERTLLSVTKKNTHNVIRALEQLQKIENNCKRSKLKTGQSTSFSKYAIFGNKINRGGHGFLHDQLSNIDPHASRTLEKWAGRMEHVVGEFIPSGWLRSITKANGFSAWPTTGKCMFVSAMASSVNYCAPAHVDDDFLFSMHQLNVNGALDCDEVVQYMCFPTYGYALGLKPGDVILFNPHVHHCLSEKTTTYINENVHVSTFYVKTAHVGKNNNTIPLNEQESSYYNMKFSA